MAIERTEKPFVRLFLSILIGAGIAMLSVIIASLDYKTAIAAIIGLSIGGLLIHFLSQKSFSYLLIAAMAFGIPFNLDVNLFFRPYIGVTSVDIGITFLSCVALCVAFFYERIVSGMKRFYSNKWIILTMLLYMGSGLLSLYNAASKELVVLELVRLTMLLIICYVVMNLEKKEYISVFILTLSVTVFLEFLLAFYQYKTGRLFGLYAFGETRYEFGVGYLQVRASGTFSHANGLAYFFEMTLPLLLAMVIVEDNGKLRLWYATAFVFGFVGLVITLSRGGWLATAISLPIVFLALYFKRLTEKKYVVALFFGLMTVMILGYFTYPTIVKRIETYDFGAAGTRVPLNRAAFSIIRQFPITGVGLNNF
ncbi:MAG: O-antigen ligase family protein, partial [Candidatus Aenigmatarchaeota archaeon]